MNFLKGQKVLQYAAMIANEFKIDPIDVLNSSKFFWEVRVAAFEHVRAEKAKEAKAQRIPRGKRAR